MLKVAAFTGGRRVPSARFRVRQYVEGLRQFDIRLREYAAPLGTYPPRSAVVRSAWAISSLLSRLPAIAVSHACDVTFLQREFLSTLFTLEPLTKKPRVLDVDDAIWLHRGGEFARKLASECTLVICGNSFLANWFAKWSRQVTIIPTAVDVDRFLPATERQLNPVIGWSGSSSGFRYLYSIESALRSVMEIVPDARLLVVADARPRFSSLPPDRVDFLRWTPSIEVEAIQRMAVGIMPLFDEPWARGKCGFKMLTYMACGIPVVVSPVGMNCDILSLGHVGSAARSADEWTEMLVGYLRDQGHAVKCGRQGRQVVLNHFAVDVVAPKLAHALKALAN